MTAVLLLNTIVMGSMLVLGSWLAPDNIIMWFISPAATMGTWRAVLLAGLLILALVRLVFDNRALRVIWGVAAVSLLWSGYVYFFDNTAYIFDGIYLLMAGLCFAIAALETTDEPLPLLRPAVRLAVRGVTVAGRAARVQLQLLNQKSTLHVSRWQDIQNTDHRMSLHRTIHA